MAEHTIIEIADAVKAELAAAVPAVLTPPFKPTRTLLPRYSLQAVHTLRVTVVPRGMTTSMLSRAALVQDYDVVVAVQNKVTVSAGAPDDAELKALLALVQDICGFFACRRLTDYPGARWIRTRNEPLYDPDHLADHGTFTSLIVFTYRVLN